MQTISVNKVNLKMNKKGNRVEKWSLVSWIVWILFFVLAGMGVYFFVRRIALA